MTTYNFIVNFRMLPARFNDTKTYFSHRSYNRIVDTHVSGMKQSYSLNPLSIVILLADAIQHDPISYHNHRIQIGMLIDYIRYPDYNKRNILRKYIL